MLMKRYIVLSFLVMFWGYYEMSGGADFVPERRGEMTLADTPADVDVDEAGPPRIDGLAVQAGAALPVMARSQDPAQADPLVSLGTVSSEKLGMIAASGIPPAPGSFAATQARLAAQQQNPSLVAAPAPSADLRAVAASRANMRDGPGTGFRVLDTLDRGTTAEVIELRDGWARVRLPGRETTGWISVRLLQDRT